jgi:preprotein translocase subunit SecD
MDRSLRWRSIALLVIVGFCVLSLVPSFVDDDDLPNWYTELFDRKMQLGLDLQGGLYIVYSIDLDKALEDKSSEIKRDVEAFLDSEKIEGSAAAPGRGAVTVRVADPEQRETTRKWLASAYSGVIADRPCAEGQTNAICIRVSSDYADSIKRSALAQAVETIRSRIDEKGIAEPSVITKGDDIIVELPGLDAKNISRIKDIIARAAKLEFKKVIDDSLDERDHFMQGLYRHVRGGTHSKTGRVFKADPQAAAAGILADTDGWRHDESGRYFEDYYLFAHDRTEAISLDEAKEIGCWRDDLEVNAEGMVYCKITGRHAIERYLKALGAANPELRIPEDREIGYEPVTPPSDADDKRPFWRSYYLDRAVRLTGSTITNAVTIWDPQTNRPEVLVEFNRSGTRVFGDLTSEAVGHKMAIILDGKVASAPVIQTSITGGRSNITMGGGSADEQQREADALVSVLKTGSLPAPLREESSAELGPTLGRDAIQKTQLSFAIGVLLVIAIMFGVYKWSGLVANVIVILNVVLMLAVMSIFGATLTLPGIAAVVLTVGMTVDGNILIYERIRDELRGGKSVKGAVDIGFARAFSAILDGQLTTAAAGWVLLQYGSGPIQGFATMLLVGIGTTLFVNTFCTRLFFDWYLVKNKGREFISI